MITRVPNHFRVYNMICWFWVGPQLRNWLEKLSCNVKNGVCEVTAISKEKHSIKAGIGGASKITGASKWYCICAQLVFDDEIKFQFPAEGSSLCHPALAQVIPSLPGQSWMDKKSGVPGTELLSGHSPRQVKPAANEGLKWKSGPNKDETNRFISHGNFN